ncbi:LysR family transcriptional regulator [Terrarubrum flagellatum]|uniref:LysR family transcriptional regulator n=1 Tax=Terrirubrum flagellatum TaxID=2895980 RepID=UPI0031456C25
MSLNAVRAFEAAARYRSLKRAADELCVTPTALSHHVRWLEDFLQTQLFERKNGGLTLTPIAKACLPDLTEGLDRIDAALSAMAQDTKRKTVVVGASPSVTTLWLLPRLHRFVDNAPGVDVVLTALNARSLLVGSDIDLSICNWNAGWDQRLDQMMEDEIVPVCAPRLLQQCMTAGRAALETLPLIHDDKRLALSNGVFPTWQRYFEEVGVHRETSKGLRFDHSSFAVAAAIDGHGMLLGRSQLISIALEEGRLVRVSDQTYPVKFQYVLASKWHPDSEGPAQFRDWLLSEAQSTPPVALQAMQ